MQRLVAAALLSAALLLHTAVPAAAAAAAAASPSPDHRARVAVITAFAPELTALRARTQVERTVVLNGVEFTLGRLAGKDVVLFLSGISMVNATMTTQLALDRFRVRAIVFSGIAGGVNPALDVGDVVVAERWSQYLESVFARARPGGGYQLPSFFQEVLPPFAFAYPQPVTVRRRGDTDGATKLWFDADPGMLAAARTIEAEVERRLRRCTGSGQCLDRAPRFSVGGNGVSGQAFVDNAAFRAYTFKTFAANVLDMESAAVATVAYANRKPFIVFRSLSDLAGGGEGENQLGTFFQLAADNSAAAVTTFLRRWDPTSR